MKTFALSQRYISLLVIVLLVGCGSLGGASHHNTMKSNVEAFDVELQDLQAKLNIPGLAYIIVSNHGPIASGAFGVTQAPERQPFLTSTPLRIASVTKSITAVIALQLVDEGRLDLDAPVSRYVPELALPEEVRVRHLLTHTSEGLVGTEYVYSSSRYAMLGKIIAAAAGADFDAVVRERIINRAGMQWYSSPELGAHAALVSTVDDMAKYLTALERAALLPTKRLTQLAKPSHSALGSTLPVSFGWFAQTIQGEPVMWSFGQDDPDHSGALLMRLPARGLSLFILANSNVLSDPFRLLMGDVTKSPLAMSFIRLFAFSPPGKPLGRPQGTDPAIATTLAMLESRSTYRYRDELIGWALIDLWTNDLANAKQKIDIVRTRYANSIPDPVLHFAALRLQDSIAREQAIRDGELLLREHPNNRWMLLAQGYLLQQQERFSEAIVVFHHILNLPNQEPDFIHRLFKAWSWLALAQMTAHQNPTEARNYLQNIIHSGLNGEMVTDAQRMFDNLQQ